MPEHTFKVGDATVTSVGKVTNRARAAYRRIRKLLIDQGADEQSAFEFAYIAAYSKSASGGDWQPAPSDASDSVLLKSFSDWQDAEATLTDEWIAGLFPSASDPVTSPDAPPEDADPNS